MLIAYTFAILLILFYGFLLYAAVHKRWTSLHWIVKICLFPTLIFYFVDVFVNIVIATIVFWEIPQELTLSKRLKRKLDNKLANFIWFNFIIPFDPEH